MLKEMEKISINFGNLRENVNNVTDYEFDNEKNYLIN